MKNYSGEKIEQLLKVRKLKSAIMAVSIMLSLVVIIFVARGLTRPAISLTDEEVTELLADFDTSKGFDLAEAGRVKTLNVTEQSKKNSDTVSGKINLEYVLGSDATINAGTDKKYVYIQLGEGVSVLDGAKSSRTGVVNDATYSGVLIGQGENAQPSGDYYVTDDGMVIIKFRDEYLEWVSNKEGSKKVDGGRFSIDAEFTRGADKSLDEYQYNIGNDTVTVKGYDALSLGMSKTGVDNGDGTVTWTITLNNPNNRGAINRMEDGDINDDFYIADKMLADIVGDTNDITVTASGATNYDGDQMPDRFPPTTTTIHPKGDKVDTIFFSDLPKYLDWTDPSTGKDYNFYYQKYEFKYTTPFDYSDPTYDSGTKSYNTTINNEAKLSNNNDVEIIKEFQVDHKNYITIEKGTPTYNYGEKTATWTVTLKNEGGLSLKDFYIKDSEFSKITTTEGVKDITVSPSTAGSLSLDANNDFKFIFSDSSTDTQVDITYTVDLSESTSGTNTAKLFSPDDPNFPKEVSVWYSYSTFGNCGKDGSVDKVNKVINWTINISTNANSLDGFVVKDDMLQYANAGSVVVQNDWNYNADTNTASYEKQADGSLVIKTTNNDKFVVVKYSTPLYVDENTPNGGVMGDDGSTVTYNNKAEISYGDETKEVSKEVTDTSFNSLNKSFVSSSYNDNYSEFTTNWKIDVQKEPGTYVGNTLVDTLVQVPEGFTIKNGFNSITPVIHRSKVGYQEYSEMTLGTDYSITYDADNNKISITFKDTDKVKDACNVNIEYTVVFNVDTNTVKAKEYYTVGNTATYDGVDKPAETKYYRPDLSDAPFDKLFDGGKTATLNGSDLLSHKDGDYYKFEYEIVNTGVKQDYFKDGSNNITIIDTLPEFFTLDTSKKVSVRYNANYTVDYNTSYGIAYDEASRKLTIYLDQNAGSGTTLFENAKYTVMIPCDKLEELIGDGTYTITNTAANGEYEPKEQKINVSNDLPEIENVLDKQGSSAGMAGSYRYEVDINPEGKKLVADGESLILIDTLVCNNLVTGSGKGENHVNSKGEYVALPGETTKPGTNNEFKPEISSIKAFVVDADGKETEIHDWNYTIKTNSEEVIIPDNYATSTIVPATREYFKFDTYDMYKLSIQPGFEYEYTMKRKADKTGVDPVIEFAFDDGGSGIWKDREYPKYDENGIIKGTFCYNDGNEVLLLFHNGFDSVESFEIVAKPKREITSLAKLTILGLPDEKHLRLKYIYSGSTNETAKYVAANVTNSIALNGAGSTSSSTDTFILAEESTAESFTDQYLKLEKLDTGDFNLSLSAGFYLHKYDEGTGKWLPAKSIRPAVNNEGTELNYNVVEWGVETDQPEEIVKEANKVFNIQLDSQVMYCITENRDPDDQQFHNGNNNIDEYFGVGDNYTNKFYFSFLKAPTNIPNQMKDPAKPDEEPKPITKYDIIKSGAKYNIKNVRKVSVTVTKNWAGLDESNRNTAVAEFELWRTTAPGNDKMAERVDLTDPTLNLPSNLVNAEFNTLILSKDGSSEVINNLPNGEDDNGSAYFYYVKEYRYTIDGNVWYVLEESDNAPYQPFYVGNLTNGDSEIMVNNAKGLAIKKIWRDINGNLITNYSGLPEIKVELYRVEYTGGTISNETAFSTGELVGTYTLKDEDNDSNDYLVNVNTTALAGYDESKEYRYYIKEIDVPEGYAVSYYGQGSEAISVMTVTNKSTIEKNEGAVLPATGSVGTKMIMVVGAMLVVFATAAIAIIRRKKFIR